MRAGRAHGALLVTVFAWASAYPAIRVAVEALGPYGLTVARLLIASAALALVAPVIGVRLPRRADLGLIVLCGLLGMAAYQLLLNLGEVRVAAGTASLLIATSPVYSCLVAAAWLGERMTVGRMAGIGVALGGATMVALTQAGGLRFDVAALMVLGAAVVHGVYPVFTKPLLARYTGLEVASYASWAGTLLVLPLLGPALGEQRHLTGDAVAATVWLGVVSSALGFVAWAYAVARLDIAVATSALYLISPLTFVIAYVWLREVPGPWELVGGAVIIVGVAVTQVIGRREAAVTAPGSPGPAAVPRAPGRGR
ncbi:MAG TPA: DMT family transporter [Pseudonocardiaceae bacterium]